MLPLLFILALCGPHDPIMVEIRVPAPIEAKAHKPRKREKKNDRN